MPISVARRRGRPVVADVDLQRVGAVAQAHLGAARAADLERRGQRVLHDAVGGDVEPGGQLALARPRRFSVTGRPAAVVRRTSERTWRSDGCGASVSSASSRRRTPSRRRSSSSASRPGALDRAERRARELRPRQGEPARARRLHGHRAQRVGDDVVQLAGDPRPLVQDGAAGGVLAVALQQRGLLAQRAVERRAGAQQAADHDRRDERDRDA